jgi:choline dehydrogenase-like flavoprotein
MPEAVTNEATAALLGDVLGDRQRRTLAAFADTIVPSLEPPDGADDRHGFWARAASHLGVSEAAEAALAQSGAPAEQLAGLRSLLDGLADAGMDALAPQAQREALVHAIADSSPEALARIAALRSLVLSLHYAAPDPATGRNANWEALGYPGPPRVPPDEPKTLRVRRPAAGEERIVIEADVCVVGSGAGGGVVAGTLAGRGMRVCVLEAGGYFNEADFNQLEAWGYQNLYLRGGPMPTAEGQVSIQAGSAVGGGTLINWQNCVRTYPWVREQWAREHGLEGLDGPEFDRHLDEVLARIGATDECSELNGPHRRLREGCEALGWGFKPIVRNVDPSRHDPDLAGFVGFGDVTGSKLSTTKTYLADASRGGAELVASCRAERVLVESGRAAGVEGSYAGPDGAAARVSVRAPVVVVACGSIESPALLRRSGIGGPAVGDYLRLHPAGAVFGIYGEAQDPWWGPPQAALSNHFAAGTDGHGFLIEGAHHSLGISAAATPWRSGRQHKEDMARFRDTSALIWLIRDRGHGHVDVDRAGNAVPAYRLADELDVANFRAGQEAVARIHHAAGAERIGVLNSSRPVWERGDDFDAFLERIRALPIAPYEHAVFLAHQMGSCRMGRDPQTSVANPWGELHDTPGVWIGDASAFPTASGTNPMVTIMALARRTAEAITASA